MPSTTPPKTTKKGTEQTKAVLDRKDIPGDKNAYIYRDAKRGGRWCLYFYDRETTNRHRFVLKDGNGVHPPATLQTEEAHWIPRISKLVEPRKKDHKIPKSLFKNWSSHARISQQITFSKRKNEQFID